MLVKGVQVLNEEQIAEIERAMREEHTRDLEALQRLKRYLPSNSRSAPAAQQSPKLVEEAVRPVRRSTNRGLKAEVITVIKEEPGRVWTRPGVYEKLNERGFQIRAKDHVAALNQALRTLVQNGDIHILRQGTGSALSEYCIEAPIDSNDTAEEASGPKSEAAAQNKWPSGRS